MTERRKTGARPIPEGMRPYSLPWGRSGAKNIPEALVQGSGEEVDHHWPLCL